MFNEKMYAHSAEWFNLAYNRSLLEGDNPTVKPEIVDQYRQIAFEVRSN